MNLKFLFSLVLAASTVAAIPNMVLAQQTQPAERDPIAMYVDAGASPEQQAKIRGLAREFEATARVKMERAANLMRKMQAFSLEPMPDEKQVIATQSEINSIQADMAMARIRLMLQIRSVLSEEQRAKLVQLLKDSKPQPGM